MYSEQSTNYRKDHFLADLKKIGHNASGVLNSMRRGLRAAAAAKTCPNDKEAILRMVSEG